MKRTSLLAAVSALALLAGPALAQTANPGAGPSRSLGGPPPATTQQAPKPNPLKQEDVTQITGTAVYGSDNKKIGTVNAVLMNPENKSIDRLVVGAGGVLGIGAHDVALPLDQFHWDAQQGGFTVAKTEAQLKGMPAWSASGSANTMSGSSTPPRPASPTTSH
ncbi:MAG TPA: PRC-barrel domain-containing protein [Stellaceae bacterium]|nr:PRC-barrel domain-containing protein [Stellaceae bacterium]